MALLKKHCYGTANHLGSYSRFRIFLSCHNIMRVSILILTAPWSSKQISIIFPNPFTSSPLHPLPSHARLLPSSNTTTTEAVDLCHVAYSQAYPTFRRLPPFPFLHLLLGRSLGGCQSLGSRWGSLSFRGGNPQTPSQTPFSAVRGRGEPISVPNPRISSWKEGRRAFRL